MTLAKGCKVNLFASEEQFPELVKPVQMAWDTRGRLWVSVWPNYPERTPTSTTGDRILILEDTDGDGRADKVTTFIDGLNCPTGFQFYKDGILLMQSPDLWFVRDTDGDGKADWKERVLMGLDAADSHHETNSMVVDQGGAMYLSDGWFMRTQVETAQGPVRNADAAIYRYEPLSQKFERYVALRLRQPARPRLRRLGHRHHHRRDRQRELLRARLQRAHRLPGPPPAHAAVLEPPVAALRRHLHPVEPPLPGGVPGQLPGLQRHRHAGRVPRARARRGLRAGRGDRREPDQLRRPHLPPQRRERRAGRRDLRHGLVERHHRAPAAPPARPEPRPRARAHLPHHLRGPAAAAAGAHRRPADPRAARAAQAARGQRARPRPARARQARARGGAGRGRRVGGGARRQRSRVRPQPALRAVDAPVVQRRRPAPAAPAAARARPPRARGRDARALLLARPRARRPRPAARPGRGRAPARAPRGGARVQLPAPVGGRRRRPAGAAAAAGLLPRVLPEGDHAAARAVGAPRAERRPPDRGGQSGGHGLAARPRRHGRPRRPAAGPGGVAGAADARGRAAGRAPGRAAGVGRAARRHAAGHAARRAAGAGRC